MTPAEDSRTRSERETQAIPADVRALVDERDQLHCRVCGKYLEQARAIHHIRYGGDRQGMGGRRNHDPSNLISICWMWAGNCHERVHANKHLWLPLLEQTVAVPGVTAMQLRRWQQRRHNLRSGHAGSGTDQR